MKTYTINQAQLDTLSYALEQVGYQSMALQDTCLAMINNSSKNKARHALYFAKWCRCTSHDTKRNQRKIKAISKGK